MRAFITAALLAVPLAVLADDLALKEYTLNMPMAKCPAGTREQAQSAGLQYCSLGATTLANQPAKAVLLGLYQGRLVSVMFDFPSGGRAAHGELLAALKEKFGPPSLDRPNVNAATWLKGTQTLHFDGWRGGVMLEDSQAVKAAAAAAAARNKSDL